MAERIALTIKAFPAGHAGIGRIDEYGAELVLVDAESPGSGEVFDWRLAEGVVDPARLIVSGGLKAENVADAIAHLHPFGVDVSSGVESAPGRKDPVKLRAFVAAARAAAGEEPGGGRSTTGPDGGDAGADGPSGRSTGGRRADDASSAMGEPSAAGRFGEFGGRFVPESLVPACEELEAAFRAAWADAGFHAGARRHPAPTTPGGRRP